MESQVSERFVSRMMDDQTNCRTCYGCGRVADSQDEESWLTWLALKPPSDLAVRAGIVQPIPCPACHGTGERR